MAKTTTTDDTAPAVAEWDPPEQWDLFELHEAEILKLTECASKVPSRLPLKVRVNRVDRNNLTKIRQLPTTWAFDEITAQGVVDTYGGGIYDVKIFDRGSRYVFQRRVELAGAPKWTVEEIEEQIMPQGANVPPPPSPVERNPAAATAFHWSPHQAPPQPDRAIESRMDRLERLLEKALDRPAPPPPPAAPALDIAALAAALRPPDNSETTKLFAGMLMELFRRESAPRQSGNPLPPGTLALDLGQLAEMAKLVLAFKDQSKGGEFLNETLPDLIEKLAPMLAVAGSALTEDPAAKKAIIDAAERAAQASADRESAH